jgi:hypothetical protein
MKNATTLDLSKPAELGLIAVFLIFIIAPVVGQHIGISSAKSVLLSEKRRAATFPQLPQSTAACKEYSDKIEKYVNDRFGFRSALVSMNSKTQLMLGTSSSGKVLVGSNGWLFLHQIGNINAVDQYRGLENISDSGIDRWIRGVVRSRDWLAQRGVVLVIAVVPNKHTIYSEFLPAWASKVGPTRLDLIADRVQATTNLTFVDMRQALFEAKSTYQDALWLKKGTHWNWYGGFIGYSEIMKGVNRFFPNLALINENELKFVISQKAELRDLSRMLNLPYLREEFSMALRFQRPLRTQEVVVIEKDGEVKCKIENAMIPGKITVNTTNLTNLPKVLIIHDSTAGAMAPYFRETFSTTAFVHIRAKLDPTFFERFKPDLVICAMVERDLHKLPTAKIEVMRSALERSAPN